MARIALFKNKNYVLGEIRDGIFFPDYGQKSFPEIMKKYGATREILDKIPNLGYEETEDRFIIWDEGICETSKLTVPLYAKLFDNYKYTGKKHTFNFVTDDAYRAANKMRELAITTVFLEIHKDEVEELERRLDAGKGICFVNRQDIPDIRKISNAANNVILWNDTAGNYVIGDLDKVISMEIDLHVPNKLMAFVIGKGGRNIKEMAKKMRVEVIHVNPL